MPPDSSARLEQMSGSDGPFCDTQDFKDCVFKDCERDVKCTIIKSNYTDHEITNYPRIYADHKTKVF